MELMLRREKKSGLMGKTTFHITAKAQLTADEESALHNFSMAGVVLYETPGSTPDGFSLNAIVRYTWTQLLTLFLIRVGNDRPRIEVRDLIEGKTFETKEFLELLSAEQQIIKAAEKFQNILMAAKTFGAETVHTFQ